RRQYVRAGRHDLPELDEGRAELLQREPQARRPGSLRAFALRGAGALGTEAHAAEHLPEAVARKHGGDVSNSADVAGRVDYRDQCDASPGIIARAPPCPGRNRSAAPRTNRKEARATTSGTAAPRRAASSSRIRDSARARKKSARTRREV